LGVGDNCLSFCLDDNAEEVIKEGNMKPKIYATGNENIKGEWNVSYYIFEKDDSFLDWLGKVLSKILEIEDGEEVAKYIINRKDSKEGDWEEEEVYSKEISKMGDVHEKYESKNGSRIDVFYGDKRIYLTLRSSRKIREKFGKFVDETKGWIKIGSTYKNPGYVKIKN
jgi:hypothetical protein